ncbi:hypothetical protein C3K47_15490 [Solitalea longa]|uniref:Uncharacterized protein n=1 Tax=Solitalea longa TaxID=2079460 RepID=A0A2S4ZZR4_9SPHI|nr:hypothetical protein [Solitalea longa]POY35462.1 hypothetical protein C3K47_15490 [Solitalea longa]
MKIRIKANTIRFRLDKNDILLINESGHTKEETSIANGKLHFCIKSKPIETAVIKLDPFSVHLLVPETQLLNWSKSDENGLYLSLKNDDQSELKIAIEKDYKCLTERNEDETASFDNPLSAHNC